MHKQPSIWLAAIRNGLIGGAVSLLICLVGMVMQFVERGIISGIITMGQVLVISPVIMFGYFIAKHPGGTRLRSVLLGALSGLFSGVILAAFVLIGSVVDLRSVLVQASPELYELLTFGLGLIPGLGVLLFASALMGAVGAALEIVPMRPRSALLQSILWIILVGLLRELITTVLQNWGSWAKAISWMFAASGLNILGALFLLVVVGGISYWRYTDPAAAAKKKKAMTKRQVWIQRGVWLVLAVIVLLLPRVLGIFLSDVLDTVGLFILMGLGLNIVVGFAGLLDLGYVAFFAIGAYTMGVLTSPELAAAPLTYWEALPIALLVCVISGVILGLPVLKMRGDYLAIVTLGFGEIVRLLVLSDWLRPQLGGTQGIQHIAYPTIFGIEFGSQQMLDDVIIAFILVAVFIATRLKDSHVGRSWMALREDEDVAKAMGINHVMTKLMAFSTGAFFAGLGGTLFAAKLSSAYPQSFQFLVSINVLALIIIGGMGSIPGVIVGGLVLVGLPELLREFAEYRYLVYGAALVAMMLTRPEGLIPEARRELELHEVEADEVEATEAEPATSAGGDDSMAVLEAKNVTKRFGGLQALSNINLQIKEKSIHSVIGPNGAGKTTFFNCVTGFYIPEEGEILLNGRNITGLSPDRVTRLGISRTYQNIRLFKNMTAVENILVGMHPHLKSGLIGAILRDKRTVKEEADALVEARRLLKFCGLQGKGDFLSKNLPYGDQRRLEVARALASKPQLLLLDEPTAGMNPSETQAMTDFIHRLRDELGITILLIEHQMRVVMGISEVISVLDFGEKIAEGSPAEIQQNTRVIEAYLGRGAASGLGQKKSAAAAA